MQHKMPLKNYKNINIRLNLEYELKNFLNKEKQYTIPIFIPHRGCKNECVFCNQRKISGVTTDVTVEDVDKIIKNRLEELKNNRNKKIEIAFFGGSFTGIPIADQIRYLKVANKYIKLNEVVSIRLSTRPDYISVPILKMLKKYNVKTIELGVQSMDDNVLSISKRGHTKLDVIRASKLINLFEFRLGAQIMVGLPGSSIDTEIKTIKSVLKLKPKDLRIYPVYVISPSKLYDMYKEKKYIPLSLEDAILRCHKIVNECERTDIRIIRLGLQSTDEICSKNNDIVGPISDNFAEYVMSDIVKENIEEKLNKNILKKEDNINLNILVPKKYISVVIGPKKRNKLYFEEKYSLRFKVKGENT